MTVPGRGGRPRKWNSDADRVRAFRARSRGDQEPPTVTQSLEQGDEGVAAWAQVRQLAETIDQQRVTIRLLRGELRSVQGALDEQQQTFGWLDAENERLRTSLASVTVEVDDPRRRDATRPPGTFLSVPPVISPDAAALNRAQRRRATKRSRKRGQ